MLSCDLRAALCGSALLLVLASASVRAGPQADVHPLIESGVLDERWEAVALGCGTDDQSVESPVLRTLKGHACLALNRNNEALGLLLSLADSTACEAWESWTSDLVERNPASHVAHYLKADALARVGRWDAAVDEYGQALLCKYDFALALNGRGVAYAYQERWDEARKDFETACAVVPRFADAWASSGTLLLIRHAAEGALESFERALSISPEFALALNGRGCAEYALTKWELANKDFADAGRQLPMLLFLVNLHALSRAAEAILMPGQENSPFFRLSDILSWDELHLASTKQDDMLRLALGGRQLPDTIDVSIVDELNRVLDDPSFYERAEGTIDLSNAPSELTTSIQETAAIRGKATTALTDDERAQIRRLNRLLFEFENPYAIAQHRQRDAGHQLHISHGQLRLGNAYDVKSRMSSSQISAGQARMDYLYKPGFKVLQNIPIPVIRDIGTTGLDHIAAATRVNIATQARRGVPTSVWRPSGVSADLRRAYVDEGDWPVANWFGLAYVSE